MRKDNIGAIRECLVSVGGGETQAQARSSVRWGIRERYVVLFVIETSWREGSSTDDSIAELRK